MKLTKAQRKIVDSVCEEYSAIPPEREAIALAVVYATEIERERMADKLASIIGMWPHGLDDLEALEARCRRCDP